MKKYIIILLALSAGIFSSCKMEIEDIFDKSSAQRIEEARQKAYTVLQSAENGWIMELYPNELQSYGGYNILLKFDNDTYVTVMSELAADFTDTKVSKYVVNGSQGPVLLFNTYNEYIHYFADPGLREAGGIRYGYEGDNEFVVMSAAPDKVILKGVKSHNTVVMTPLPAGVSWESYMEAVKKVKGEMYSYVNYDLVVKGNTYRVTEENDYTVFQFPDTSSSDEATKITMAFMHTDDGIRLYEPVTVDGVSVQNFLWDKESGTLTCIDEGTGVIMTGATTGYGKTYEGYIGDWRFHYFNASTNTSLIVSITEKEYNKTLTLSGLIYSTYNYPITLHWRRDGRVEMRGGQSVGFRDVSGSMVEIFLRACSSTSSTTSTAAAMITSTEANVDPDRLDFISNGYWAATEGVGYYYTNPTTGGNTSAGKFLMPMYMVKQ